MISATLIRNVEGLLLPLRKVLDDIGVQVKAMHSVDFFAHDRFEEMTRQVDGVIRRALEHKSGIIAGAGFAWRNPETDESGMLWWRADEGPVTPKVHVYNPHADAFYDYGQTEWYRQAQEEDSLAIAGPFIDAWGTDDHALTPSQRIDSDSPHKRFLGVAAVDLQVHRVTEYLSTYLEQAPGTAVVNAEGHIVSASHPLLTPGIRLERFFPNEEVHVLHDVPLFVRGWRLLALNVQY